MDFKKLSSDQREAFHRDGFLVVPGALDHHFVERLVEAGDEFAAPFLGKFEVLDKPWYNDLDFRPGLLQKKAFLDLVSYAPTVSLVVQLLSENIHLHSTALTYKRPENPSFKAFRRGWHRDLRLPRDLGHVNVPMAGIKICYCLSNFDVADSGMTILARGSHRRDEPLVISKDGIDPEDFEVCDLNLKAGDAVLFQNGIFHTATPNRTDRVAKRIIYGYAYRWLKQEIYLDPPDAQLLRQADPVTRQLIGGYRDIDTRPWALLEWTKKHDVRSTPVPWYIEI
ncbi:MAG: hypothetical protein GKR95_16435 [Gammaproteobacteria bacterium]|nr:hypothetical protein [Gammaproteobacteria bacterium]NKB63628.1 hypothetical protein [Gammaproteobacteria bacterium]